MKFFERNSSAKYRAEGLNIAQASRIDQGNGDLKRNLLIAGLAFVAVGSLAYIGLQTITGPVQIQRVYSAAPPQGTAMQMMMALKVPHDREQEAARLAILNDNPKMEIKPLDRVEQLINPERVATTTESAAAVTTTPELTEEPVEIVEALPSPVLPEVEPLPEPVVEAPEVEAPVIEVASVEIEPATSSCFSALQEAAASSTIFFGVGSAQLSTETLGNLQKIGRLIDDCPEASLHVTGHSDTTGNDLTNLNLSWQRADNVVSAMGQLGLDTSRIAAVGFGARSPLTQGDASDEELNRRVEFVVIRKNE